MMTNSNWTGRTHRTLESAFGYGVRDMHTEVHHGSIWTVVAVLVAVCVLVSWLGWF